MRNLDDKAKLDRFLELKGQIAELTEEFDGLKDEVLYALMEEPEQKYQYKGFEFTVQRRKKWKYSPAVKSYTDELKALKKLEEANGTAELQSQTAFPVVKAIKS